MLSQYDGKLQLYSHLVVPERKLHLNHKNAIEEKQAAGHLKCCSSKAKVLKNIKYHHDTNKLQILFTCNGILSFFVLAINPNMSHNCADTVYHLSRMVNLGV